MTYKNTEKTHTGPGKTIHVQPPRFFYKPSHNWHKFPVSPHTTETRPRTNLVAARLYDVVQQHQCLVDVPPVLAVVVNPLPDHLHDLGEGDHIIRQISDLRHERTRRTPGVVRGRLPNFDLRVSVVLDDILHRSSYWHLRSTYLSNDVLRRFVTKCLRKTNACLEAWAGREPCMRSLALVTSTVKRAFFLQNTKIIKSEKQTLNGMSVGDSDSQ